MVKNISGVITGGEQSLHLKLLLPWIIKLIYPSQKRATFLVNKCICSCFYYFYNNYSECSYVYYGIYSVILLGNVQNASIQEVKRTQHLRYMTENSLLALFLFLHVDPPRKWAIYSLFQNSKERKWQKWKINIEQRRNRRIKKRDIWVAQRLCICFQLRVWSRDPESSLASGSLQGACFSLCLCLCLSLSFVKK